MGGHIILPCPVFHWGVFLSDLWWGGGQITPEEFVVQLRGEVGFGFPSKSPLKQFIFRHWCGLFHLPPPQTQPWEGAWSRYVHFPYHSPPVGATFQNKEARRKMKNTATLFKTPKIYFIILLYANLRQPWREAGFERKPCLHPGLSGGWEPGFGSGCLGQPAGHTGREEVCACMWACMCGVFQFLLMGCSG